jgi:hypothetical protein
VYNYNFRINHPETLNFSNTIHGMPNLSPRQLKYQDNQGSTQVSDGAEDWKDSKLPENTAQLK